MRNKPVHFSRLDCPAHPRAAGGAALSGVNLHRLGIAWRSIRYSPNSLRRFSSLLISVDLCTSECIRDAAPYRESRLPVVADELSKMNEFASFVYWRPSRTLFFAADGFSWRLRCLRLSIINLIPTLCERASSVRDSMLARNYDRKSRFSALYEKVFLSKGTPYSLSCANACFPINFSWTFDFKATINCRIDAYRADSQADSAVALVRVLVQQPAHKSEISSGPGTSCIMS